MNQPHLKQSGFTIVELIVVIICIGILASISAVAYSGTQAKARDAARTDSLAKIKDALELYYVKNGRYPSPTVSPGSGGWEVSTDTKGTFLEQLYGYGVDEKTVDPVNAAIGSKTYTFYYYRYAAGSDGCVAARGAFYVLRAVFESANNRPPTKDMTGECTPGKSTWFVTDTTSYVWRSYEID